MTWLNYMKTLQIIILKIDLLSLIIIITLYDKNHDFII